MHPGHFVFRFARQTCAIGAIAVTVALLSERLVADDPPAAVVAPSLVDLDVQAEHETIASARRAMSMDDEHGADAALMARMARMGSRTQVAPSVTLARRTAGVCGWLQSDNDYARAERLARRTLLRLYRMQEDNDADRVERLYWEAWLEGYALDHKARALELLQQAAQLAPDDARILEDSLRWAEALAAFGR